MNNRRFAFSLPLTLGVLIGMLLVGLAVFRWAPESLIRLTDTDAAVAASERHAHALGFTVLEAGEATWSAGDDDERLQDPGAVLKATKDRRQRRALLRAVPPLRLRVPLDVRSKAGDGGQLSLEVGPDGQLLDARFDIDPERRAPRDEPDDPVASEDETGSDADQGASMVWADAVAPRFFAEDIPAGEGTQRVRIYRADDGRLLEVRGQPDDDWHATLLPAEVDDEDDEPLVIAVLVLVVFGLAMAGMFLWRLGGARLGFGHAKVMALLVIVHVVGNLATFGRWVDLAIFVAFAVPSLTALLAAVWAVTEAELRDYRPQALEAWDRLIYRQPLRTTGDDLLIGVAWGWVLAGLFALGGRVGWWLGGGYAEVLGHPHVRLLPALLVVVATAFGVGAGGRVLGTRGSTALGVLASACMWMLQLGMTPLYLRLPWGLLMGGLCVALLLRHGVLVLMLAATGALTFPSLGLVLMTWPRWWLGVLVGLALLAGAALYGILLRRSAPTVGSTEQLKPAYLSKIERIARLETEVELLRNFQLALLPEARQIPFEGGEAAWQMRTADQVGGDFLDFEVDEDGRLWLAIADVAGHGIACSMFTAFAKAAIAEHASAGVGPAQALTRIRRLFRRLRSRRSMVTMLLAVWDPRGRTLCVASAGHPPLVVWDGAGAREIGPPSRPLGIDLPGEDREETVVCPAGTIILGYTDGVVEAESPYGEAFGFDRWPAALPTRVGQPASVILDALLADLDHHRGDVPAADDVTAVVVTLS